MSSDDPKIHRFTPAEAAMLAGMGTAEFLSHLSAGYFDIEMDGGKCLMTDAEAYRLVTMRFPSLSVGKAVWMTCGRHTFMAVPQLCQCPECRRPMRRSPESAAVLEVVSGSAAIKRCRRCGEFMLIRNHKWYCDSCRGRRRAITGNRVQTTWDGEKHSCCGSRSSWRHRNECENLLILTP